MADSGPENYSGPPSYPPADPYAGADSYDAVWQPPGTGPYQGPGQYGPADYPGRDPYGGHGPGAGREPYGPDRYPGPGPGQGPDPGAGHVPYRQDPYPGQDRYSGPERYYPQDHYAETDPYARTDPHASSDPYRGADSRGPASQRGRYDQPAGYPPAGWYPEADPADPYAQADPYHQGGAYRGADAYGQPDRYQHDGYPGPARDGGYGQADDYGPAGTAGPAAEPYRWQPPADLTGPDPASGPWAAGPLDDPGSPPGRPSRPAASPPGGYPHPDFAGYQDGWREDAGAQRGWPEDAGGQPGWREEAAGQPGWHDDAPDQPSWREEAADQRGWRQDRAEDSQELLPGFGGRGGGRGPQARPRRRRLRWVAPLIAVVVVVGLLAGGGIYAYRVYSARHGNYQGAGFGSVTVQVLPGEGASALAPTLVKLGVIKAAEPFTLAAEASKATAGLQPGYFRLHRHMNAALAYQMLISPASRLQIKVTIPEGLREVNIIRVLGAKSGISEKDFATALKDTAALGLPSYARGKPEGYLFPATYLIAPHETALGVLQAMVVAFKQEAASANLPAVAKQDDFTPAQIVVEASLIQAEGRRLQDFPKIARVIDNRLNLGMPLQLDSTVLYALGAYGIAATDKELKVNSPYNTYLHTGLPPGPIDSPGAAAINAALHPVAGNWIYFVTVNPKTGLTKFTDSAAEFAVLENELRQYQASHPGG